MKRIAGRMICMLLTAVLCAGLLPAVGVTAHAESKQERQQAVVASCFAYYDKGQSVQYDGSTIVEELPRRFGGTTRSTNAVPAEFATPDETMYSVCSDFAHQVYWDAFHYSLMGSAGECWTGSLFRVEENDPMLVRE